MEQLRFEIEPFANDPAAWSASLVNLAEILIGILDVTQPRRVAEVGAYAGDLTGLLLDWTDEAGSEIVAIDPAPQPELEQLAARSTQLELVRETSFDALGVLEPQDAIVIDGDHNYYTVRRELELIADRSPPDLPVILAHDVSWPHARRDDYFAPSTVPEAFRQPTERGGRLFPGEPDVVERGLKYSWPAAREGGKQNGVLTALEDFVEDRDDVRLVVVPAFYGLGVMWRKTAEWSEALLELLEPWEGNPVVQRLERNRVVHIASAQAQLQRAVEAEERADRQEAVLRRLLASRAFDVAEALSRVRERMGIGRGHALVSKREIRRALDLD